MKAKLYILAVIIIFASCEKRIDWQIQSSGNQYIVIESIITNENKNQTVKISKSVVDLNDTITYVSGANVSINDETTKYTFTEDSNNPGFYISDQKIIAAINRTYTLTVIYGGETYSAQSGILAATDFTPISYYYNSDNELYSFSSSPQEFSVNENAMYEILIDRSNNSQYADTNYETSHSIVYYYTLKTIDVPEIFSPDAETVYFPDSTIITQRKYSLTDEHAEFIRSLLLETNWRGNIFDVEQGNVITNFNNGALGYFGVCSVIEKSFIVE